MVQLESRLVRFSSIEQAREQIAKSGKAPESAGTFTQVFEKTLSDKLTFSKHAGQRILERDISLTQNDLKRLGDAVSKAGEKGVRNTLVLVDSNAFIVNVPSGTVITAVGGNEEEQSVFTQIDGAVIA